MLYNIIDGIYYDFVWNNNSPMDLVNSINNKENFDTVCIIGPEEHQPSEYYINNVEFNTFVDYCKMHNKKLKIILGGNSNGYIKDVTIPWDTYILNMSINHNVEQNVIPMGHKTLLKHFISMNARAHAHRLRFLDHMSKYDLMKYGYVSFHNFEKMPLDHYKFRWWKPRMLGFDYKWFNPPHGYRDFLIPPQQFQSALWSVVSESTVDAFFVTEKTWMPIYHKRPFIVFSTANFHKTLKNKFGFKLFDNIVDYSFDSVEDEDTRCDLMMQAVAKLCTIDINEQQKILQPIVEHNFNRLMEIIQDNSIVNEEIKFYLSKTNSRLEDYNALLNIGSSEKFKNFMIKNRLEEYLK